MHARTLGQAALLIAATATTFAWAADTSTSKASFERKSFGLEVRGSVGGSWARKNEPSGRVTISEQATVDIAGQRSRTLTSTIVDEPAARGGVQKATIVDGGKTTTFAYTPATNAITIGSGSDTVSIVQNADHSYTVDGKRAATGKAAVALLASNAAYQQASPHSVLLAYSYAQLPNQAEKGINESTGGPATPPVVCTLFKDFCECAACDKAGKGNACTSCK